MKSFDIINIGNHITIQRFLTRHISSQVRYANVRIMEASITIEPSRHRTGVPDDASCQRYVITHVAQGWSVVARSVWRNGRLLDPRATHTRIELYLDDDGRHSSTEAVAVAFNGWLKTLDL